jgi:hypothetical protein
LRHFFETRSARDLIKGNSDESGRASSGWMVAHREISLDLSHQFTSLIWRICRPQAIDSIKIAFDMLNAAASRNFFERSHRSAALHYQRECHLTESSARLPTGFKRCFRFFPVRSMLNLPMLLAIARGTAKTVGGTLPIFLQVSDRRARIAMAKGLLLLQGSQVGYRPEKHG